MTPLADAPILGMQRFIAETSAWDADPDEGPPLASIRDFLVTNQREVFAECSDGPGLNCSAHSHGGFDDDETTLQSVATFLK